MSEPSLNVQDVTHLPLEYQPTFDELGVPLREVTFVVVDLETTGGSPAACAITEIGAVKVRGGEVLGTFQTLVNPDQLIPPFIAVLTGITQTMVATAPRLDAALSAFLDFAHDTVLVAHNAPFDLGFLKAACTTTGRVWPDFDSIDTARLARRVLTRDEAPNCKLSTLARLFRTRVTPSHRALADAEATVDVLHGLLDRLGNQGVQSLDELRTYSAQVTVAQRRKRHLAESLPHAPGVYLFKDERGKVLYVGKSKDLRTRVRNYFVASENRTRMSEMVGLAQRVDHIVCATGLEAEVRELRLIGEHKPRYNRRSRFPERAVWLKVTDEPFPRLSTVREVRDDGATYLGPFGTRGTAERALTALHDSFPIRQCTPRLSPRKASTACVLAEMGRCGAPCDGTESVDQYAVHVEAVRVAITVSPREVVAGFERRMSALASSGRYEDAAIHRDRLGAFVRASARMQRLAMLSGCPQLVAAQPTTDGGWELHVVRHGRLVAAGVAPRGAAPRPYVDALVATAETVRPGPGPTPCASAEEMECVLRWLDVPGTRLVELDGVWASPAYGAGGSLGLLPASRDAVDPFADRRGLRPVHQPTRVRLPA
ncbi:DEDD exonuclease domain-containing protein [Acidothermaceae bacterium B102]|nr:DEDD exonuclease domain-containing protein [Acidothermaceae bacterium B102]